LVVVWCCPDYGRNYGDRTGSVTDVRSAVVDSVDGADDDSIADDCGWPAGDDSSDLDAPVGSDIVSKHETGRSAGQGRTPFVGDRSVRDDWWICAIFS
jgi:hypothetical protein